jgi:hypothetical protein
MAEQRKSRLGGTGAPVPRKTLGATFHADEDELPLLAKGHTHVVPPRSLTVLADVSNLIAGVSLTVAFMLLVLMFAAQAFAPMGEDGEPTIGFKFMTAFMCIEGICYCVAGATLTYVNVLNHDTKGIFCQAVIAMGGLCFACSAFGNPAAVTSVRYVFSFPEDTPNNTPLNACAHYGITCFMVATAVAFSGVWRLDRSEYVSPFWGVGCFLAGAWIIGVFVFWLPTFAGGMESYSNVAEADATKCDSLDAQVCMMISMPAGAWAWKHYFGVLGAGCLTLGAYVFAALDQVI